MKRIDFEIDGHRLKKSVLKIIPKSGHLFMFETPQEYMKIMTEWLEKTKTER